MSAHPPKAPELTAEDLFFCIVAARYNPELLDELLRRTTATLREHGVPAENIEVVRVPGSHELPYAAHVSALSGQFDAIIALGLVIAGDTNHHDVIAHSTAHAFHDVSTRTEVPVINGVITVHNQAQAEARITGHHDRGREFAHAALEMAALKVSWMERLDALDLAQTDQEAAETAQVGKSAAMAKGGASTKSLKASKPRKPGPTELGN